MPIPFRSIIRERPFPGANTPSIPMGRESHLREHSREDTVKQTSTSTPLGQGRVLSGWRRTGTPYSTRNAGLRGVRPGHSWRKQGPRRARERSGNYVADR